MQCINKESNIFIQFINSKFEDDHVVYVYGAGRKAGYLFGLLNNEQYNRIRGIIVSDGYREENMFYDKPIFELSEVEFSDKSIVLLTIEEEHKDSVIVKLKGITEYYYITGQDYKTLYRKKNSFEPSTFINQSKPISRLFGFDRGQPIDRFYIEEFLNREARNISNISRTLEVAEDGYIKKLFPDATHEILDYTKGMDLTKDGTIDSEKYDLFICTQTLNVIYDIKSALSGCANLLKVGGTFLATVGGNIAPISKYDMDRWGDYWRFTYKSIEMLVKEVFGENVRVCPYGNAMAATAFIQGLCVEDIDKNLLEVNDPDYAIVIGVVAIKGE